jgi:hypothetical protein
MSAMMISALQLRVRGRERRWDDGEVRRHVVGDRERCDGASGDKQLLPNGDYLDELRGVRVEVHHVRRLFRGGRS